MSLKSLLFGDDEPTAPIVREVLGLNSPAPEQVNSPAPAKHSEPAPAPKLTWRSTAREIAAAAVRDERGAWRYRVPAGWQEAGGDVTLIHHFLNLRAIQEIVEPPAPVNPKPRRLTQEEKDQKRVEQIRATCLTKKAFRNKLENEGFAWHQYESTWVEPSEEQRQSLIGQWIEKQKAALGWTTWSWPRLNGNKES